MSADDKYSAEDLAKIQGNNGDWDVINTLVFMVTSFTTVGYGNHPSFVTTPPMCEYPRHNAVTESPFSNLLPVSMRQATYGDTKETTQFGNPDYGNSPLPEACFSSNQVPPPECWVMADADKIFDFSTLRMYERRNIDDEPRQYVRLTAAEAAAAAVSTGNETAARAWPDTSEAVQVPGGLGRLDCTAEELGNSTASSEFIYGGGEWVSAGGGCWARFVGLCEKNHLTYWRAEESKKTAAKLFTIIFVLAGIGILGTVAGSFGDEITSIVHRVVSFVEATVEQGLLATGVKQKMEAWTEKLHLSPTHGHKKQVLMSSFVLIIILLIGSIVYSLLESMAFVDALYFTVVTATTVGFGDCA